MNKNILLVEDDSRIMEIVNDYFSKDGFQILEAENGESARYKELKEDKFYLPEDFWNTSNNINALMNKHFSIDCDKSELDKGHPIIHLPIQADANQFLTKIVKEDLGSHQEWLEFCGQLKLGF